MFWPIAIVKSTIESARGVGQVIIEGAVERAIQINIDADKLAAYRTSIMQVHDAIVAQNAEVPGGRVDAGYRELSLRTLGRMPDRATSTSSSSRRSTTCRCGSATWAKRSTSPRNAARSPCSTASRPWCCRCSGSRA